jgi:hypothetical protein
LWLKIIPTPAAGTPDYELLEQCCAWAEQTAQAYRQDCWNADSSTYVPDAEVLGASTVLAGRIYRRRNSPSGIETFSDTALFVARFDPEVERGLRMGSWLTPARAFGAKPPAPVTP